MCKLSSRSSRISHVNPNPEDLTAHMVELGFRPLVEATSEDFGKGTVVQLYSSTAPRFTETVIIQAFTPGECLRYSYKFNFEWLPGILKRENDFDGYLFKVV